MLTTKIAIVGATGLVGQMIIKVLQERKIVGEYFLFAGSKHAGDKIIINGDEYVTETLTTERVQEIKADFALFAASADVAAEWAPIFVAAGTTVIDNSSHYRMDPTVPLIVPEINLTSIGNAKLIANPNCSTIGAVVALAPLDRVYRIKRIVYATYQAISGAGSKPQFPQPIINNVLPEIDVFMPDGSTKEETKMINETKKILGRTDLAVTATAARVPVANCHCVAINVEFEREFDLADVKSILSQAAGVVWCDDYAVPTQVDGQDAVYVGRVRRDLDHPRTLNLWTVSDNLRKGAATNAVQIMESLLAWLFNYWFMCWCVFCCRNRISDNFPNKKVKFVNIRQRQWFILRVRRENHGSFNQNTP